jgi:hypothetical protein
VRHRGVVIWATTVALAGAAGIGAPASAGGGSSGSSCDLPLGDVDDDDHDGALVILVDGTVSVEGAGEEGRGTDLVELLDESTRDAQLDVTIGSFGGSDAEVRFSSCLDGTAFVARGNNARTRERNRPALLEAATAEIAALASGYVTSDPTAALRAGVDRLGGVDGARSLVIHTDGIPTAGCAALPEQTNVSDLSLVDELVATCAAADQLPDADGVDIVIGGIGRTDEDLSAEAVTFLIALNQGLCEATGATCRVDPNLPSKL